MFVKDMDKNQKMIYYEQKKKTQALTRHLNIRSRMDVSRESRKGANKRSKGNKLGASDYLLSTPLLSQQEIEPKLKTRRNGI